MKTLTMELSHEEALGVCITRRGVLLQQLDQVNKQIADLGGEPLAVKPGRRLGRRHKVTSAPPRSAKRTLPKSAVPNQRRAAKVGGIGADMVRIMSAKPVGMSAHEIALALRQTGKVDYSATAVDEKTLTQRVSVKLSGWKAQGLTAICDDGHQLTPAGRAKLLAN